MVRPRYTQKIISSIGSANKAASSTVNAIMLHIKNAAE
jgi:hypothetical protein